MGNTLTGQIVAETYDALLKVTDNNQITGTKKRLTDGFGTDTPMLVSSTDVQIDGNFLTESVQFNTATSQTADAPGKLAWNDTDGTLDLRLKGGNVTLQVGQEQVLRVVNKAGANLLEANYQAVRVTGAQGNRLKVDLAQANNDLNSAETIGLVTETINDNQEGFITTSGLIRGINTTGSLQGETWADGDMLYLSGTTAGQLTNIKPSAPTHTVIVGYVVRAHASVGQIFVKVDNGYELDELHNVSISSASNNDLLVYESATSLWKNKSLSTIGGVSGTGTTNYVPKFTSGTAIGNGIIFDDGTNVGIGTTTPTHKFTVNGAIRTQSGSNYALFYHDGTYGNLQSYNSQKLYLNALGNDIILGATGNVSVGTTTASAKFHVVGNTYFDGNVGIGTNSLTGFNFRIEKGIGGATTAVASYVTSNVQTSATASAWGYATNIGTDSSVIGSEIVHFRAAQKSFGSGTTITNQIGFASGSTLTSGTNNFAFYSSLASGTNRWNLYMVGTARNYLAGVLTIGTTSPNASAMVQIDSTTQGFLPPRMTQAQRTAIASPATGLIVYQTDGTEGLYVRTSTAWVQL